MTTLFANNVAGTLNANIGPSDTAILLGTGQGARFPSPTGGNFFWATLIHASTGVVEVVKCTGRATDTLTVTRGEDSTTPNSFTTGSVIEMRMTAQMLRDLDWSLVRGVASGLASLDGSTKVPTAQIPDLSATYLAVTRRGAANGVASLDASTLVPDAQIPAGIARTSALASYIPLTQKAAASGVATLDGSVKVPVAQIPSLPYVSTSGGSITGSLTVSANIGCAALTAAGDITAGQNFISASSSTVLGGSGGTVFLRSNAASATNQATLTNAGVLSAPTVTATSDRRKKKNLRKAKPSAEIIEALQLYDFQWKATGDSARSPIAQHVLDYAPQYVHRDGAGYLSVDKAGLALEGLLALAERVRKIERSEHARRPKH